jgi:aspartyl/asparaginyl beta-hydroxylase (cupin superfamily)
LSLFKETFEENRAYPQRPFPLRSHFDVQRPLLFYPGLNTLELHDVEAFRWVPALEAAYPAIKEELLALLEKTREWAAAYLWVFGEEVEGAVAQCPETANALRQAPEVTSFGTILVSALAPRTFLAPHYGYTNAKLRCQLPLSKTEGCRVKVADIEIEPKEGKCLIFDDSFLHSAWNEGDTVLYMLAFDFFHPDLSAGEIEYLSAIFSEP